MEKQEWDDYLWNKIEREYIIKARERCRKLVKEYHSWLTRLGQEYMLNLEQDFFTRLEWERKNNNDKEDIE